MTRKQRGCGCKARVVKLSAPNASGKCKRVRERYSGVASSARALSVTRFHGRLLLRNTRTLQRMQPQGACLSARGHERRVCPPPPPRPRPQIERRAGGSGRGLRGLCASDSAHLERLVLELGRDEIFLPSTWHTCQHTLTPPTNQAPVSPACQRLRTRGSDDGQEENSKDLKHELQESDERRVRCGHVQTQVAQPQHRSHHPLFKYMICITYDIHNIHALALAPRV